MLAILAGSFPMKGLIPSDSGFIGSMILTSILYALATFCTLEIHALSGATSVKPIPR